MRACRVSRRCGCERDRRDRGFLLAAFAWRGLGCVYGRALGLSLRCVGFGRGFRFGFAVWRFDARRSWLLRVGGNGRGRLRRGAGGGGDVWWRRCWRCGRRCWLCAWWRCLILHGRVRGRRRGSRRLRGFLVVRVRVGLCALRLWRDLGWRCVSALRGVCCFRRGRRGWRHGWGGRNLWRCGFTGCLWRWLRRLHDLYNKDWRGSFGGRRLVCGRGFDRRSFGALYSVCALGRGFARRSFGARRRFGSFGRGREMLLKAPPAAIGRRGARVRGPRWRSSEQIGNGVGREVHKSPKPARAGRRPSQAPGHAGNQVKFNKNNGVRIVLRAPSGKSRRSPGRSCRAFTMWPRPCEEDGERA